MATKNYCLILSPEQLAYLAGVVDSEGSISVLAQTNKTRKSSIQVRLNIGSTSAGLLIWICKHLKGFGAFTFQSNQKKSGRYKNCWNWVASTRQAEVILKAIKPYLITKIQQADHALETLNIIAPHSTPYSEARQQKYNEMASRARELNTTGITEAGLETKESFKKLIESVH